MILILLIMGLTIWLKAVSMNKGWNKWNKEHQKDGCPQFECWREGFDK